MTFSFSSLLYKENTWNLWPLFKDLCFQYEVDFDLSAADSEAPGIILKFLFKFSSKFSVKDLFSMLSNVVMWQKKINLIYHNNVYVL